MVGFAVLAGLAIPAFPKLSLIALFWILAVFGAGIEAIQSIPALGRAPSFEDWLADILGAGAILLVVGGILRGLVAGQAKD
jgi:VanZ family protein